MSELNLDPRLFRYALASAEYGSFRRAAAALNVQQSSVSKGIRRLESGVGAPLFERGHAGVRPTTAGDFFLREAKLGIEHLERAMRHIDAAQRGEQGNLVVAASVPFLLVGELLERFQNGHQGVSVEVAEGSCNASSLRVHQRRADIAFVAKVPRIDAAQSLYLGSERMIAVLPKSHRLARSRALAPEQLGAERLILSASGLGPEIADLLRYRMRKSGVEPIMQMQHVGQYDLVSMVARGFGVTVTVGPLAHAAPDGVALIPLAGRHVVSLHAVWMESNPNPALKGLLSFVRRSASGRQGGTSSGIN